MSDFQQPGSIRQDGDGSATPEHLFALFLKLAGRKCLVVGGGPIAEGKISALLGSDACVTVVAPQVTAAICGWAAIGRVSWESREFRSSDLEDVYVAIGATDDRDCNAKVFAEADARGILCNVVDDPEHCHFYFPSVVDRGALQIAISTTGQSPALAQRLRRDLESFYGEEYAAWVRRLGEDRAQLFQDPTLTADRRREILHQQASDESFRAFVQQTSAPEKVQNASLNSSGKVYLVGAGPGDPELLTVKATRLIQAADVVLHDDLVGPETLALIPSHAEVRSVGKRAGGKHTPQAEINDLLLSYARAGKRVVRLKGGDPLLFGRAGEEIQALREAGIRFEIVPGVTAALSAAASARIPLTDRRLASSVIFASAHACAGNSVTDWAAAAKTGATIVVYMPGEHRSLAASLLQAGLAGDTPCAVVSQASLPGEQIESTSLQALSQATNPAKPNLLIIGAVAAVARETLSASPASEQDSNLQEAATR